MSEGFYSRLAGFVQRHRWTVLAVYAAATIGLAWQGSQISLKADIIDLLPDGSAPASDLRFYLEHFGSADVLFLTVTTPGSGDPEVLEESARRLSERLMETGLFRSARTGIDEEEAVDAARHAMAHLPILLPADGLSDLRRRVTRESVITSMQRLRSDATGPLMMGPLKTLRAEDPLGLLRLVPRPPSGGPMSPDPTTGLLLSEDGSSLLVMARPERPAQDLDFSKRLVETLAEIEDGMHDEFPDVIVDYAGGHLFAVEDESRIRHDIKSTATIAMVAVTLLFSLALRKISLLLILMIPLALSTLWTLGVASLYPGHLNVVTVAFAAILLGMGDDSLTHLYLRFREETSKGSEPMTATRAAMGSTGPSILVATLTSGLGFAVLTLVEFRGLAELGLIAAIGLINLLVAVFFLFPCFLPLIPRQKSSVTQGDTRPVVSMEIFVRFHRWASAHRTPTLVAVGLILLIAAAATTRLEFSADLKALRGHDPAQERLDRVMSPFGGSSEPIHLVQEGRDLEEGLRTTEALGPACETLRVEGLISGCALVTNWLPAERTQKERFEMSADIQWDEVERHVREAARDLELREEFFAPFLVNLRRYGRWEGVRLEYAPMDSPSFSAGFANSVSGSAVMTTVFPSADQSTSTILRRARQIAPEAFGTMTRTASIALVTEELGSVIKKDFRRASLIALVAVALTALLAFRRPSRLLLVGTPVAGGCLFMLGGLAILEVPINLMNLVATPLVLGLGIDFGVYMVNRHLEEGCADIPKVLRHTGGAILLTGLTTIAGFGSLLSAGFAGLRSMGWVAVLGIGGCLLTALMILPLLLPKARASH